MKARTKKRVKVLLAPPAEPARWKLTLGVPRPGDAVVRVSLRFRRVPDRRGVRVDRDAHGCEDARRVSADAAVACDAHGLADPVADAG